MTRLYDLMLLIDPNAPDGRQDQVMREVQSMIESGGELVGSHDWGERRLAFEIDHRPEAQYHLFQFESETDLLERLQHQLKIMDGVLRFRIIRLKPGAPTPPPPRDTIVRERREEREPEGRVAARAAADAAPEEAGGGGGGRRRGGAAGTGDAPRGGAAVEEAPAVEEAAAAEEPPRAAEPAPGAREPPSPSSRQAHPRRAARLSRRFAACAAWCGRSRLGLSRPPAPGPATRLPLPRAFPIARRARRDTLRRRHPRGGRRRPAC